MLDICLLRSRLFSPAYPPQNALPVDRRRIKAGFRPSFGSRAEPTSPDVRASGARASAARLRIRPRLRCLAPSKLGVSLRPSRSLPTGSSRTTSCDRAGVCWGFLLRQLLGSIWRKEKFAGLQLRDKSRRSGHEQTDRNDANQSVTTRGKGDAATGIGGWGGPHQSRPPRPLPKPPRGSPARGSGPGSTPMLWTGSWCGLQWRFACASSRGSDKPR
jgi:hypothetical protein